MENFGRARTDARTQMALMGRGQAFSELMALRNQPINEITALLSGSQVNNPQVAMAQPAQIPTVDNAGLIMDNYRQRQANYQQQMQQRQALMGGLFDVAAAGFSGGFG